MRRRNKWLWTVLLLGLLVGPEVLAQVESPPTLLWTRDFVGTKPSGVTELGNNQFERDSGTGSCATGGAGAAAGNRVQIDWATGQVYVAYTDGTLPESGGVQTSGVVERLSSTTGGTVSVLSASAAFDVAACGIAIDQRGRIYAMFGPCDTVKSVNSLALTMDLGTALEEFSKTEICASGGSQELFGPVVDVFTDRSDNATRFSWGSSATGAGRTFFQFVSDADPEVYTDVCSGSPQSQIGAWWGWRNDGVFSDYYWASGTGAAITGQNSATCAGNTGSAANDGHTCTTADWTLDCFRVQSSAIEVNRFDPTDVIGAKTINATVTPDIPDPLDDGLSPIADNVYKVFTDQDGAWIGCGIVRHTTPGGTSYGFLAKWLTDGTLQWNVTFLSSSLQVRDCDFGKQGEVVVAGFQGTPSTVRVRKYCCNTVGVNISQFSFSQIEVDDGGGGGGAAFDLSAQCAAIGTAMSIGLFGCNLLMTAVLMLGMAVSTTTTTAIATRGRAMALLGVAFAVGALIGLLIAWALEFASGIIIFVITMIAIVLIGLFVLIRRG